MKLGHEVTLITTCMTHRDGEIVETEPNDYRLNDGMRVVRLRYRRYPLNVLTRLLSRLAVYPLLKTIHPDFIFYHGLISSTIFDVIKYVRRDNPDCVVVQDNHLDYNIGSHSTGLKKLLGRGYFRFINRISNPYVARVYGVTPWRKTYAEDYFRIPANKTDVLIMGADDEMIDFANRERIRADIREQYGFADGDFVVVTGGKIDANKRITLLMEACRSLKGVKLLVFGAVKDDVKAEFDALLAASDNIVSVGWIKSDRVYDYFFAADLVVFPGQHSVLWEQACASKVPCVFEKWEGMDHVNNGGNSDFVSPVTAENLRAKLEELLFCLDVSNSMLAQDYSPDRLSRAKLAISRIVDRLDGDRIGLIIFAGTSFVQLPITTDYVSAKMFLNTIDTQSVPVQGTAIGDAILTAAKSFSVQSEKSRAIIVITDGENHEDDPVDAARQVAETGIRVYTVGVGSLRGQPIPLDGDLMKDKDGNIVVTRLDEETLKRVASEGNGAYVHAGSEEFGLNPILAEIRKLEDERFNSTVFEEYDEQYMYFFAAALFFFVLEMLVGERRAKRRLFDEK